MMGMDESEGSFLSFRIKANRHARQHEVEQNCGYGAVFQECVGMLGILLYHIWCRPCEARRDHLGDVAVIFNYQFGFHDSPYVFSSTWIPSIIYSMGLARVGHVVASLPDSLRLNEFRHFLCIVGARAEKEDHLLYQPLWS